ncbi:MAG: aromatic amino acid transport family protein [Candidatus Woesearchaeota archaeon]
MDMHELGAIATLVGCIVGAGMFAIPYAVAQAGFLTGLLIILVIGLCALTVNLYVGEVFLRTEGNHALTTLASRYLGKKGKGIMKTAMILGIYGGLIAYIIGEGAAISSMTGINPLIGSIVFSIMMAGILFFDIGFLERVELLLVSFIGLLVLGVFFFSFGNINTTHLSLFQADQLLVPFGVVLFAYSGVLAIGEMKEELGENKQKMKRAIVIGSIIPIILYVLFSLLVVGVTGSHTTEIATIGLGEVVGTHLLVIGNLFVIIAMATSFLTTAYALKEMYMEDHDMQNTKAWGLVMIVPLVIAFSGITSFISALDISGALATGAIYLLVIFMHKKAKEMGDNTPQFSVPYHPLLMGVFMLIFVSGIIYQVIHMLL